MKWEYPWTFPSHASANSAVVTFTKSSGGRICIAIWFPFKRVNGSGNCQLIGSTSSQLPHLTNSGLGNLATNYWCPFKEVNGIGNCQLIDLSAWPRVGSGTWLLFIIPVTAVSVWLWSGPHFFIGPNSNGWMESGTANWSVSFHIWLTSGLGSPATEGRLIGSKEK